MKWLILGPEIYFLAVAAVFLILSMTRPNGRRDFSAALFLAGLGVAVTSGHRPAGRVPFPWSLSSRSLLPSLQGVVVPGVLPRGLSLLEPEWD